MNENIHPSLENDPDYQAFIRAQQNGEFAFLAPGTLVAFGGGEWVFTAATWDQLYLLKERRNWQGDLYVDHVNTEPVFFE